MHFVSLKQTNNNKKEAKTEIIKSNLSEKRCLFYSKKYRMEKKSTIIKAVNM